MCSVSTGPTNDEKKILIVEDDADIRHALKDLLEMEGMSVVLAADGREGLQQLEVGHPIDVILLDLMMPVMSGWEFIEHLKKHATWNRIPVIAISAAGSRVGQVNADAFIKKPLDLGQLLDTIRDLSESRQAV